LEAKNDYQNVDQHLVKRILEGDRHAYPELIGNTQALVAQIVYRMIPHPPDRADIAQDIYLKAYKNLSGFRFQSKLSTWIGQISFNTCMHYRDKKRLVLVQNGEEEQDEYHLEKLALSANDIWESPTAQQLDAKQLSQLLDEEINSLSPLQQTILNLYHIQELSLQEICDITAMNDSTIRSHLFRARKQLRQQLTNKYKRDEL